MWLNRIVPLTCFVSRESSPSNRIASHFVSMSKSEYAICFHLFNHPLAVRLGSAMIEIIFNCFKCTLIGYIVHEKKNTEFSRKQYMYSRFFWWKIINTQCQLFSIPLSWKKCKRYLFISSTMGWYFTIRKLLMFSITSLIRIGSGIKNLKIIKHSVDNWFKHINFETSSLALDLRGWSMFYFNNLHSLRIT